MIDPTETEALPLLSSLRLAVSHRLKDSIPLIVLSYFILYNFTYMNYRLINL